VLYSLPLPPPLAQVYAHAVLVVGECVRLHERARVRLRQLPHHLHHWCNHGRQHGLTRHVCPTSLQLSAYQVALPLCFISASLYVQMMSQHEFVVQAYGWKVSPVHPSGDPRGSQGYLCVVMEHCICSLEDRLGELRMQHNAQQPAAAAGQQGGQRVPPPAPPAPPVPPGQPGVQQPNPGGGLSELSVRLSVMADVAAAVQHMHGQRCSVLHNDLRAQNIMLQVDGDGRLIGKVSVLMWRNQPTSDRCAAQTEMTLLSFEYVMRSACWANKQCSRQPAMQHMAYVQHYSPLLSLVLYFAPDGPGIARPLLSSDPAQTACTLVDSRPNCFLCLRDT
jgi:hypothetical protein